MESIAKKKKEHLLKEENMVSYAITYASLVTYESWYIKRNIKVECNGNGILKCVLW